MDPEAPVPADRKEDGMRKAAWGLILGASLALLAWVGISRQEASAQRPTPPAATPNGQNSLIALGFEKEGAAPQVVVIDPQTRSMSVYHIDRASGEISLKSVRNVRWDLMMEEFNGVSPTPSEIRSLLNRR